MTNACCAAAAVIDWHDGGRIPAKGSHLAEIPIAVINLCNTQFEIGMKSE